MAAEADSREVVTVVAEEDSLEVVDEVSFTLHSAQSSACLFSN